MLERFLPKIKFCLTFTLFFIAVVVTIELIRNLIFNGRKKLAERFMGLSAGLRD